MERLTLGMVDAEEYEREGISVEIIEEAVSKMEEAAEEYIFSKSVVESVRNKTDAYEKQVASSRQ